MAVYYIYQRHDICMSSAHALGGGSGVASLISTDEQLQYNRGCYFLEEAMLTEGFPFHQFNISMSIIRIHLIQTACR